MSELGHLWFRWWLVSCRSGCQTWWRHQWKHFPRYWPFVRGIHRSLVNSLHKGQWRRALIFSLICALNKRLSKQAWDWWMETPSRPFWRHCNEIIIWIYLDLLDCWQDLWEQISVKGFWIEMQLFQKRKCICNTICKMTTSWFRYQCGNNKSAVPRPVPLKFNRHLASSAAQALTNFKVILTHLPWTKWPPFRRR